MPWQQMFHFENLVAQDVQMIVLIVTLVYDIREEMNIFVHDIREEMNLVHDLLSIHDFREEMNLLSLHLLQLH